MWRTILVWLGFAQPKTGSSKLPNHGEAHGHGHTHGTVDPGIATSERGIWAIKWSFAVLAVTSVLQLGVVVATGSVALLADTIHNFGDATTAIPLWIAFRLARRKPSPRFTHGYGRAEDFAGVLIMHSHAPNPVNVRGELAGGVVEIVDTPQGERMRFVADSAASGVRVEARIARAGGPPEVLALAASVDQPLIFWSSVAPQEPHEFEAQLILRAGDRSEILRFGMTEPAHLH